MNDTYAEVIQLLEKADDLFKTIDTRGEEAIKLWDEGIERLASAIWICERQENKS
jgi:hypothetical protein